MRLGAASVQMQQQALDPATQLLVNQIAALTTSQLQNPQQQNANMNR